MTQVRVILQKVYFRGLPIAMVVLMTVIMVVAIQCKKPVLSQTQSNISSATITLIGFTVLFAIIEGVGFVYYMTRTIIAQLGLSKSSWVALFALDKYLLLINSMTNVIAYVAFNSTFRTTARNMIRGQEQKFHSRTSAIRFTDI